MTTLHAPVATLTSLPRLRARLLGPALLCLALLTVGRVGHAQPVPVVPLPWAAPTTHDAAAPSTYDQDFATLCKAVEGHFYDPAISGLDWPRVRAEYARRLESVTNDAQFLALMNDLLGLLHASHTRLYGPDDFEFYLLPEVTHTGTGPAQGFLLPSLTAGRPFQIGCLASPDAPGLVAAVLDGSPAAAAGLRVGDSLVSVDGRPYRGLTQFGSAPVRLVYRRHGAEAAVTVTPVARSPLNLMLAAMEKSARVIALPGGRRVGYVRLWCMGDARFQGLLESLVLGRLHDTDGLVLDLRQGYGGSPFGFADPFFLPDIRVSARDRQVPHWVERHEGYGKPLVVLVDRGTRSAKEWLAWTLQASKRATLVGQRTAGAELGLQTFRIGAGFLLELAVEDLTLDGVRLEGAGVEPDVTLPGSPSDDDYLRKALQVLARERTRS